MSPVSELVGKSTNTTENVFTDSVLCLGGRCQLNENLGKHTEYFEYRELHGRTCGGTIRLAKFSGTNHHEDSPRDQVNDGREKYLSIGVSRKDHIH